MPVNTLMQIREDFLYFYPVDSRHSGRDLIPNHLTFYVFNHVAIFSKEEWPRQIVVNGSVLMDGKKMSKSLGNIIPLRNAIKEYGADPIRLAMISSAELLQDADFSFDAVKGITFKLTEFYELITDFGKSRWDHSNDSNEDLEVQWLRSRTQRSVADTTFSLDKLRAREALHNILYTMEKDLQWYFKRSYSKKRNPMFKPVVGEFIDTRIRLLSPFAPHFCEELWKIIGHEDLVSIASWPKFDESKISILAEENEYFIFNVITDIQKITKIARIKPKRIIIYTASMPKWKLYHKLLIKIQDESKSNIGTLFKELVTDKNVSEIVKGNPDLVKKLTQDILSESNEIRSRRMSIGNFDESIPLKDALDLLKQELGTDRLSISIMSEDDSQKYDPKGKSKHSRPFKPALYIE
jgi:leucyl-tRNA synthetase